VYTGDAMKARTVREARAEFGSMIDEASKGGEVVITRRGKPVARVVGLGNDKRRLPAMAEFRRRITVRKTPLSQVVAADRDER
jgi:prevent-host-death family protein